MKSFYIGRNGAGKLAKFLDEQFDENGNILIREVDESGCITYIEGAMNTVVAIVDINNLEDFILPGGIIRTRVPVTVNRIFSKYFYISGDKKKLRLNDTKISLAIYPLE